ncbi:MAG: glycosyltransferase family 2 protein [bacterium]
MFSIIIPNWNGKKYLEECILFLKKQSFQNYEIIVIDNGSKDDSVQFLKEIYSDIIIIENKKNLGFCKAVNQGIKKAKQEFIIVLNNDVIVQKNWLENLSKNIKNDKIGMWGSKILYYHNPKIINSTGILITPDLTTFNRGIDELDKGQYDKEYDILGPSAACAMYRKTMLEEIGLFDENYFCYREDDELALRAQIKGWKAVFVSDAICFHHRSASTGIYSLFKLYYTERNRIFNVIKFLNFKQILKANFYTIFRYFNFFKKPILRKESKNSILKFFFILCKSYFFALFYLPKMLIKRYKIQPKKQIIQELLKKYEYK